EIGCVNVRVRQGDGTLGWPEAAPFDAIMVTAAGERIPPALIDQLKIGGRLIMPIGSRYGDQVLVLVERKSASRLKQTELWPVRFVPLIAG
ncbi:MAG: protein-L-isoaspartate O-methyltransferase, partial [Opitutaceae bacterium]|nr:protein-L-isoaspartate O-methyltransferase [Opitutaceae bacterium]